MISKIKIVYLRYTNLAVSVKAGLWFTICAFLQKGINFITTPIFTRLLSPSEYGTYNVYNSWLMIVTVFATLNLYSGSFVKGLLKFKEDKDGFTSSIQGLATVITLLCLSIYLCFKRFFNHLFELPTYLVCLMFLEILTCAAISFWNAKNRMEFRYKNIVAVTLAMSILNPIIGIIAIKSLENGGFARILSVIVVQAIFGVVLYIFNITKGRKFYDKKYWLYSLGFNIPLLLHYLSSILLTQVDRLMINEFVGKAATGIYSLAYSAAMVINILATSINSSLEPWILNNLEEKRYSTIRRNSLYIVSFLALIIIMLILVAPEFVRILASEEYFGAIDVIPPIALSVYFVFAYSLLTMLEFYFESKKTIMWISFSTVIINVILNYYFIQKFGYIAAGYTTLISYIFCFGAHAIVSKHISKKQVSNEEIFNIKGILLVSIVAILISTLIVALYDFIFIRYAVVVIVCAIGWLNRKNIMSQYKKIKMKE